MNINNSLIKKIDNLVSMSKEFDENFKKIIGLQTDKIDENNVDDIYRMTSTYILIRSEHGSILLLIDKVKNLINISEKEEIDDEITNKLYNYSTFTSILSNINDLINNIDYQYKKIALKYPKFINKKPLFIILFTDDISKSNKYVELIDKIKDQYPENKYKVIQVEKTVKKIKCDEIIGCKITIKINSLPSLFIINDDNITEIPIEIIKDPEAITNLIK